MMTALFAGLPDEEKRRLGIQSKELILDCQFAGYQCFIRWGFPKARCRWIVYLLFWINRYIIRRLSHFYWEWNEYLDIRFAKVLCQIEQVIFTHLELWVAVARHNSKSLNGWKIKLSSWAIEGLMICHNAKGYTGYFQNNRWLCTHGIICSMNNNVNTSVPLVQLTDCSQWV